MKILTAKETAYATDISQLKKTIFKHFYDTASIFLFIAQFSSAKLAVLCSLHQVLKNVHHFSQNDTDGCHTAGHNASRRLTHSLPHFRCTIDAAT